MTIAKALSALIVGMVVALLGNYGISETSTLVDSGRAHCRRFRLLHPEQNTR